MLAIEDIVERVSIERGWSRQTATKHARIYLLFLSSCDNGGRVPSEEVDAIWHEHILHTRRYREDCFSLVGHFIDHQPKPRSTDLVGAECSAEGPSEPPDIVLADCTKPVGPPDVALADCISPARPTDVVLECTKPEEPSPPPSPRVHERSNPGSDSGVIRPTNGLRRE